MTAQAIQKPCPVCDGLAIRPYRHVSRTYAGTTYDLFLRRCDDCGFVFLANDPHIECDAAYLNLEQVIAVDDELARFRAQERIAGIARLVPPAPERQFLNIGIGDGLLLSMIEKSLVMRLLD